ncbi:MOSC N-terminal beta barrel domain-containing protein [Marinobacter gelidimuriae]|uniref:MOSC N-terminal beta barrel domain-containing protein n=1 Tax=Marinobacter gelidimuriae TaxID=2739064 RepID=UPI0003A2FD38|nr:MOSC domain-containing protein [Marinobacter gelidimuriae]
MRVHSLFLYPVKSLAGIAVDSFELDEFGPAGDRRWMLVDDECQFVTQRTLPQLALVQPSLGADGEVSITLPRQPLLRCKPVVRTCLCECGAIGFRARWVVTRPMGPSVVFVACLCASYSCLIAVFARCRPIWQQNVGV